MAASESSDAAASTAGEVTRLLREAQQGRTDALDEAMALVYDELRAIARQRLARRRGSATLQATELAHEAFLRLVKQRKRYDSRGHFFAIASTAMLRVLLDADRARRRSKRGGELLRVTLGDDLETPGPTPGMVIPSFVEALGRLGELDARSAEVAQLRLLWGLTDSEIATALEVSLRTVERDWRFAKRWLAAQLQES